jgi:hypothetical protein
MTSRRAASCGACCGGVESDLQACCFLCGWVAVRGNCVGDRGGRRGLAVGRVAPSPRPLSPFHGGEGRSLCFVFGVWCLVFGVRCSVFGVRCSVGEPRTGVRGCECGGRLAFDGIHAARPGNAAAGLRKSPGVGAVVRAGGPLTPTPPPFHGGEGRNWCSVGELRTGVRGCECEGKGGGLMFSAGKRVGYSEWMKSCSRLPSCDSTVSAVAVTSA